jgi:diguanylate cyclase (GGDEF)-like protein
MAVIAIFVGAVNYFVLDALENIARRQIVASIESSAKAYVQYEGGRRELFLTRAIAMAAVAHLKATLAIPGVDTETVRYTGESLRSISDMPVMLLLDPAGRLLADVGDSGTLEDEISSISNLHRVLQDGEVIYEVSRLGDRHVRLAAAPVISGSNLVGVVVIGQPIGTAEDIRSLRDLSSVNVGLVLDGTMAYPGVGAVKADVVARLTESTTTTGLRNTDQPVELKTQDGDYYAAAIPLPGTGSVLFYVSRDDFVASVDSVRSAVVAASLLAIFLGGIFSSRVASRISAPIGKLTRAVEMFGKGTFDHNLEISSRDEVGTLASSFMTMAHDIEDNRRQLVSSKEAAEASNRAKSAFLATMSHEIRTPLNGVLGMVELLKRTPLESKQAHYCNTISSSSKSLMRILNDILDHSKIEAGRLDIDLADVSLDELVNDAVNLFTEDANSKGLTLHCDIHCPGALHVRTDPVRVRQVLTNLISNAVKFTKAGSVKVRVEAIMHGKSSTTVRFAVIDTGMGMDSATQERVFDSFSQGDGSMSREFGGTGLGLSISRQLVELLGGELLVESEPSVGSRFWFDLDLTTTTVQSDAPPSRASAGSDALPALPDQNLVRHLQHFHDLTALLVEDNPVNQEVARESLQIMGIDVVIASNGREAVELFDSLKPSFILMDCQMPEMDGYEATRAIRSAESEDDVHAHVPIIALTANALRGDREKCIECGMDDFIGKPFELQDIQEKLLRWFTASPVENPRSVSVQNTPATREDDTTVFDGSVLESLRALGQSGNSGDLVKRVVTLYLEQAPDLIGQISDALADGNTEQIALAAHTLKSSSANVGALQLSRQCQLLETVAREGRIESSINHHSLQQSFDAVVGSLEKERTITGKDGDLVLPSDPTNKKLILVVDDDESFRITIGQALEAAGFNVETAASGTQAEEAADKLHPDLMLLDAIMPEFDGFEVCRRFAANPGLADIPVLMVTGLDDRASVDRAFESGASGFVTKPIQYPILGHQIRFVIRANETAMALRNSEQRLATAQHIASLGYWVWNTETGDFTVSDEFSAITSGREIKSLAQLESVVVEEDRDGFRVSVDRVVQGLSTVESTYRLHASDGSTRYVRQCLSTKLDTKSGLTVVAAVQDVTARRVAEEQVRYLAYYDSLTGLASRTRLYERIEELIKSARRRNDAFAVLFLDLDGFKDINDSLGHSEGDKLLTVVAQRLKASFRDNDFLARFGGDEFCIVLEDISDGFDISQVITRCLNNLAADVELNGQYVQPRASIGISRYPDDGDDLKTLLRAADSAMYEAKANGKHRFAYFDSTMTILAEQRIVLAQALRSAFDKKEFELHYQPQISLEDRRTDGYEALVRWNHPTRGLVLPGDFVPELERLGLINNLGDWAINQACRQLSFWRANDNIETRVCVNISPTHFQELSLIDTVRDALDEFGIPPENLELEVTETALQYSEQTIVTLSALDAMGVRISIDDFGSGFSCLGSLQHLPIDCLKIDRMFIRDLLTNPKDAVLLGTIMSLAHALGFKVVAEGVENQDQVQVLDSLSCDLAQGFYFSRPLPADRIPEFVESGYTFLSETTRLKAVP